MSQAETERVSCHFCKGTGKDPFDQLYRGSSCQVCHGRKEFFMQTPHKRCACCQGSGVAFSSQNTCTACLGRGLISIHEKQFKGICCKICQGSGKDTSTHCPCVVCLGLGEV